MKPPTSADDARYRAAASEMLRALRGRRSQRAMARRLGFRSNISADWEHGRRYPTASETLRVAERLGFDLKACFERFAPASPPRKDDGYAVASWLDSLRGSTRNAELAQRMNRSRSSIGRWLSGESQPRLPDFLHLLDAITGRVAEWIAALVPIDQVPTFADIFRRAGAARRIALELPWSEAVLRVIETTGYRSRPVHDDAYIASALGVSADNVTFVVQTLVQAAVILLVGERYEVTGTLAVDTRDSAAVTRRSRHHWARVAFERVRRDEADWFAYNVISVSEADCDRIEQILRAAFREVRGIVSESAPSERAALLTLHLTRWST